MFRRIFFSQQLCFRLSVISGIRWISISRFTVYNQIISSSCLQTCWDLNFQETGGFFRFLFQFCHPSLFFVGLFSAPCAYMGNLMGFREIGAKFTNKIISLVYTIGGIEFTRAGDGQGGSRRLFKLYHPIEMSFRFYWLVRLMLASKI